jgi:predicted acyl esterase
MKKIYNLFFAAIFFSSLAFAQLNPVVDSIPMSDGKKVAADVYIPSGCSSCPVILIQTPYNRLLYHFGLPLGVGLNLNASNYAFVIVDWRCFYGSSAACVTTPDRGQDGYDVIQWITSQSWSNGKVGTWGPSALGEIQFLTAKKHPPGLICCAPIVASPVTSYFDYYPNGVLRTEYVQQLAALGYSTAAILAFPFYNVGWQVAETNSSYPDSINVPCLMIGGWYDHNTVSLVAFFDSIRQQSPVSVQDKHRLLMGPWTHNAAAGSPANVGALSYPEAQGWSDSLCNLFFDYHIRNINNGWNNTPYVTYFQMGDNAWQTNASWPPTTSSYKLYMHSTGVMDVNAPVVSNDQIGMGYDPRDPSPTVGGATLRVDLQQGPYDQAPVVESRTDVRKFTTAALTSDVRVTGKPKAYLFVSSDKYDTDFAIRLTDVYPNGSSMLLSDGIFRMRFRNGYTTSDTSSITPNQVYPISIQLPDVAITFKAGHRIRLDITSSNYPRYDCNLNNGLQEYTAGDTVVASNNIYFNNLHASYINLPIADSTSSIAEVSDQKYFDVFPNPASDVIEIFTADFSLQRLELCDISGKIITSIQEPQPRATMDVRNLSNGVYFLRARSENASFIRKVVVMKK